MQIVAISAVVIALTAAIMVYIRQRAFALRLDRSQAELTERPTRSAARSDLPDQVLMLARRLGASEGRPAPFVTIEQTGSMWKAPGAKPQRFTARQTIATSAPGFMWRARMDPFGSVSVADYFVAGHGGLSARVLGAFEIANESGTAEIDRGEALRYLAELPWNPDAILHNRALRWTVLSPRTLRVSTEVGGVDAEVTFELDDAGLIGEAKATERIYRAGKQRLRRPWRGRFWHYRRVAGRIMPMRGEVAWVLDGGDFVYWSGAIESWRPGNVGAQERLRIMMLPKAIMGAAR